MRKDPLHHSLGCLTILSQICESREGLISQTNPEKISPFSLGTIFPFSQSFPVDLKEKKDTASL